MGWERKRGKLHELNRLLRGARDTSFIAVDDVARRSGRRALRGDARCRYAPAARHRAPAGRHDGAPTECAGFDARSGRVVDGYAILQPRVAPSLPLGYEGSRYQRLVSGAGGIDPYASAVSDVYQDLFGEGSTSARASTTSTPSRRRWRARSRERAAQPRSVRGHLRAGRARFGHRSRRRVSRALRGGHRSPASLGARRLAAAALAIRLRPRGHRPSPA